MLTQAVVYVQCRITDKREEEEEEERGSEEVTMKGREEKDRMRAGGRKGKPSTHIFDVD